MNILKISKIKHRFFCDFLSFFFFFFFKERNILCLLPDRCTLPPPVGNRCSRSRLFAFYFWRPPFENSALWHGTTGARGACIKGPWQREVPTHAHSVNWLRRFSVAPFGCEAPENLGSGKGFRSSNAFCPLFGALRGICQKKCRYKNYIQGVRLHLLPRLHQFQRGRRKNKNKTVVVARGGTLCLFLITAKGGLLSLCWLQSPESHQKKGVRRQVSQGAARVSS